MVNRHDPSFVRFAGIALQGPPFFVLRGRSVYPAGTLAVVGTRHPDGISQALYFLDPSLEVRDSIMALPYAHDAVFSPDESRAYVTSRTGLIALDLGTRTVVRNVPLQETSTLSISPDGDRIFLTNPATLEHMASGIVTEFSRDLLKRREIRLADPRTGLPPSAWQLAVAADGRRAYVLTGSGPIGAAHPGQEDAIYVVDLDTGKTVTVLWLGWTELSLLGTSYSPRLHLITPRAPN
jgi:DNA-binding beta-propeller fold protein YncE